MNVILDENVSNEIKRILRSTDFDVLDLKEKSLRQLPDKEILDLAIKEDRIIITHDRDYLVFMLDVDCKAKIILIYLHPHTEERVIAIGKFLTTSNIFEKLTKSAIIDFRGAEISYSLI
ncbi:DUF5615 family PIN-like protein [Candidatus Gottesmanbacteria bacterium]|nr:DUF5615 family PIN-like protein [Candidatus Gottesmanbacteria bacterium]